MRTTSSTLNAYRGARVLVLGGSGFIGAWIARLLDRHQAIVTVTARHPEAAQSGRRNPGRSAATILGADFEEAGAIHGVIAQVRPHIVFNLVGYGIDPSEINPSSMTALNTMLVDDICAAMTGAGADGWTGPSIVHTGSALEHGPLTGIVHEDSPANPTTEYGRTKLRATRLIQERAAATGLKAVVCRLFTVYGPGEHSHRLLPSLLDAARSGRPLALTDGRQPRDFTYVEDVAEGLLRVGVSAAPPGTIVNLATSRLATVREFAETAASVLGFDRALLEFGALPTRNNEMWHGTVDVDRLRALVSWIPPTTIADGIRRTAEFQDAE